MIGLFKKEDTPMSETLEQRIVELERQIAKLSNRVFPQSPKMPLNTERDQLESAVRATGSRVWEWENQNSFTHKYESVSDLPIGSSGWRAEQARRRAAWGQAKQALADYDKSQQA